MEVTKGLIIAFLLVILLQDCVTTKVTKDVSYGRRVLWTVEEVQIKTIGLDTVYLLTWKNSKGFPLIEELSYKPKEVVGSQMWGFDIQ